MDSIILILLIVLVFKDDIKALIPKKKEEKTKITQAEKKKIEKNKKDFSELMDYNMYKAIESKRNGGR